MNYYNYFTEIEETFVRRRGKNLLLSPIDWAMIESWQERGIPLHIVLRAIETVFDGFDKNPGNRTIKGLLYCREEIEAQYKEWLEMNTGKPDDSDGDSSDVFLSKTQVAEHIDKAIGCLRSVQDTNLHEDIERACSRLEELKNNLTDDAEMTDGSLSDIENFLDSALLSNSDKAFLAEASKEITAQLKPYKSGMEPDVYKKTFDLMVLKKLREKHAIPRLSLFYL